jgi:6-phosphogluconolactonase
MSERVLIANAADATISVFALEGDRLVHRATTALPGSCSTFAVDPVARLVYAFVKAEVPSIVTLRLEDSGALVELSRSACGAAMAYLELTPDGRWLLGASYHAGIGAVWPVSDGVLGTPTAEIAFPNLHCVKVTADGDHAYFVSLGAELIAQYALNEGALTPLDPPTVAGPDGSGPRHLVLSDDERDAYLVTEFSGEVVRFARDDAGRLTRAEARSIIDPDAGLAHSRFGADPRSEHLIWGADLQLAAGGRLALASERTAGTLATLVLDAAGRLGDVVALRPTEPQPRGFAVAADGTRAVVVGELSTTASLYAIGADGVLVDLDRVETGRGANWVRTVPGGDRS